MQHAQMLERVRQLVKEKFTDQGMLALDDLCETILVRDGLYCGRCFTTGELRAVWFIEEGILKFSSRTNGVFLTCSAAPPDLTANPHAA